MSSLVRRTLAGTLLVAFVARAEPAPILRIDRPSLLSVTVKEDPAKSKVIDLPPGYFVPDETFQKLDVEVRRLQAVEAEHKAEKPQSTVYATVFFVGLAIGAGAMLAATKPWEAK